MLKIAPLTARYYVKRAGQRLARHGAGRHGGGAGSRGDLPQPAARRSGVLSGPRQPSGRGPPAGLPCAPAGRPRPDHPLDRPGGARGAAPSRAASAAGASRRCRPFAPPGAAGGPRVARESVRAVDRGVGGGAARGASRSSTPSCASTSATCPACRAPSLTPAEIAAALEQPPADAGRAGDVRPHHVRAGALRAGCVCRPRTRGARRSHRPSRSSPSAGEPCGFFIRPSRGGSPAAFAAAWLIRWRVRRRLVGSDNGAVAVQARPPAVVAAPAAGGAAGGRAAAARLRPARSGGSVLGVAACSPTVSTSSSRSTCRRACRSRWSARRRRARGRTSRPPTRMRGPARPPGKTRLEATKDAIKAFVRRRVDDRVGLVVFSDNAYVVSPLTFDHDYLRSLHRSGRRSDPARRRDDGDRRGPGALRLPAARQASRRTGGGTRSW